MKDNPFLGFANNAPLTVIKVSKENQKLVCLIARQFEAMEAAVVRY